MKIGWIVVPVTAAALLVTGCGGGGGSGSAAVQKSTLLVYMTGSDLEERFGYASMDMTEMLRGYAKLGEKQRGALKVVVAFGGARKTGWRGVRYADMACLADDAEDGVFGNAACYGYENTDADMGDAGTLEDFLRYNANRLAESERNYLVFWNHGSAYKGVCFDSNKNGDSLTVGELDRALEAGKTSFDMIGMDACLMGNIEVVRGIYRHADYYLASEESEPGHGWDYEEVLQIFGDHSTGDMEGLGKRLVDSYLDSPKHRKTENKTLAFMKMSRAQDLLGRFDSLCAGLNGRSDFKAIGTGAYHSRKFSIDNDHEDGIAIDFKQFLGRIAEKKPSVRAGVSGVSAALDDFIVYARGQDGDSNGISIFQPLDFADWTQYDRFTYVATTQWHTLLSDFTATRSQDHEAPEITAEPECSLNGKEGYCLGITDNVAIKEVESYGLVPYGNRFVLLYSELLAESRQGYFLPKFEDTWYYLCDSGSKKCVFPSAMEVENPGTRGRLYTNYGQLNGEDVVFFINIDGAEVDMWAVPDTKGGYSPKRQLRVKKGDTVRFDYLGFDKEGNFFFVDGDPLKIENRPVWSRENFDVKLLYFAMASDFSGNDRISGIHYGGGSVSAIDTSTDRTRLAYLSGKALTLEYDYYGTAYTDTVSFSGAPKYYSEQGKYILEGKRGRYTTYCYSEDEADRVTVDGTSFMYDCFTALEDGARDLFVFNIGSGDAVSGYYYYAPKNENPYVEIRKHPDAVLGAGSSLRDQAFPASSRAENLSSSRASLKRKPW